MMIERFLHENKSLLEEADIEFKISIYQHCPFSLSGGSRSSKLFVGSQKLSYFNKKKFGIIRKNEIK